jgi:hypothetical protein
VSETTPSESESYQLAAGHRELLDQILDKWSLQVLERLCTGRRASTNCAENSRR